MWNLINYIFSFFVKVCILIVYIYVLKITFYNIWHYNSFKKGIIVEKERRKSSFSETPNYYYYTYQIKSNEDVFSGASGIKAVINKGDSVSGYLKGRSGIKITSVNNVKITSRYGIIDYVSLFLLIGFTIMFYKKLKYRLT